MNVKTKKQGKPLIVGAGEALWDLLPAGKQLGGAPANFAYHAHALGAESLVISRVGNDVLGTAILDQLHQLGLQTSAISIDPAAPTGTVSVALDERGKPTFTIHENVAWDYLQVSSDVIDKVAGADAVCFGTLGQRSPVARETLHKILKTVPLQALRVFDINLRQQFWSREVVLQSLALANVLKLNDEELPVVAGMLELSGDESSQLCQLARRYSLKAAALTKGGNGSLLWIDGELVAHPGSTLQIADTVGAGDSYTATMVLGILAGKSPGQIIQCAHRVADYVCTQHGATPPLPRQLIDSIS